MNTNEVNYKTYYVRMFRVFINAIHFDLSAENGHGSEKHTYFHSFVYEFFILLHDLVICFSASSTIFVLQMTLQNCFYDFKDIQIKCQ
jgi:hypothetical protein